MPTSSSWSLTRRWVGEGHAAEGMIGLARPMQEMQAGPWAPSVPDVTFSIDSLCCLLNAGRLDS